MMRGFRSGLSLRASLTGGYLSFPDCLGSFSTLISMILGLVCQGAAYFVGCQFLARGLNGLGPSPFGQFLAECQGRAHLKHNWHQILL